MSHCPTFSKCCFGRSVLHAVFPLFKKRIFSYLYFFFSFSASRTVLSSETRAFLLEARHPKSCVPWTCVMRTYNICFWRIELFFFRGVVSLWIHRSKVCSAWSRRSKKGNVWSGMPQNKRAIACTDKKNFVSIAKSRAFLYGTTLSDQVSWLKWSRWLFSEKYSILSSLWHTIITVLSFQLNYFAKGKSPNIPRTKRSMGICAVVLFCGISGEFVNDLKVLTFKYKVHKLMFHTCSSTKNKIFKLLLLEYVIPYVIPRITVQAGICSLMLQIKW